MNAGSLNKCIFYQQLQISLSFLIIDNWKRFLRVSQARYTFWIAFSINFHKNIMGTDKMFKRLEKKFLLK